MPDQPYELMRVLWKSHPYGWMLRYLEPNGHYVAELLIETPPLRRLHSGIIPIEAMEQINQLAHQVFDALANEPPPAKHKSYVGFLTVTVDGVEAVYHYYPYPDSKPSTRAFVRMILLIDLYVRPAVVDILNQDQSWATGE